MPRAADAHGGAGSTRRTPAWLIALAAILLALRIGTGIYEARTGYLIPPDSPVIQIQR
jgi:hypothetical protein